MTLRIVGAGVGRTGTASLKQALEQLLGGPCYHMFEVFQNRPHIPVWAAAARGEMPDWRAFFADYAACVDWPAASFWPEIAAAFPEVPVLLTHRDPQAWWESIEATIARALAAPRPADAMLAEQQAMTRSVIATRFTDRLEDRESAIAAFKRHNDAVRAGVPAARLVEWQPGDGWGPLCAALGVPEPDEAFPHVNTRDEFVARITGAAPRHPGAAQ